MPLGTVHTLLLGDITRLNGLANFLLPRVSHRYKIWKELERPFTESHSYTAKFRS